jgi:uroporphyrinogen-III decarboxylase
MMRFMKAGMNCGKVCKFMQKNGVEPISGFTTFPLFDTLSLIRSFGSFVMDLYDEPDLIHAILKQETPKVIQTNLKNASHNPIKRMHLYAMRSDMNAISPAIFDELCAKHYKKRNELCRRFGIDLISLDCDGVTSALQSTWMENGVNILFPIEVGVWGDQFAAARERFGARQRGVGGMDKTALRKDKAAVDAEIERMESLASLGGFIPCPDHRLMPGTKFELVQYYAEQVKKIKV